jgi:hypothetical protein
LAGEGLGARVIRVVPDPDPLDPGPPQMISEVPLSFEGLMR